MFAETKIDTGHHVDTSRGGHSRLLNQEWMRRPGDERFLSLQELHDHVWRRSEACTEKRMSINGLEIKADAGKPSFRVDGQTIGTTHWAFSQVCRHLGAPADYLRGLHPDLTVQNLEYGIENRQHDVKIYADDTTIRAVTSPTYGRIHDHKMVAAVQRLVEESDVEWKIPGVMSWSTGHYHPSVPVTKETTTLFASDRDVAMFLCDDNDPIEVGKLSNGDPDLMFRGFFLKNSEVGDGSLYVATMYLRGVCANRCLWGIEGFREIRIRHTRNAPYRMIRDVQPVLNSYRQKGNANRVIEGVVAAKESLVIETPPWQDRKEGREQQLNFLMKTMKFSKVTAEAILGHQAPGTDREQLTTVWDFVNQVTSFAQEAKHHNRRLEIENKASLLLERATASV